MAFDLTIILFVILGLISGLLGGLLGLGGGIVTVPALYYIFLYSGIPDSMQIAAGTSLAAGFITSGSSTYFQNKRKASHFPILKRMIPGLIAGCLFGAAISEKIPSEILRIAFGIIALFLGIYFFFPKLPQFHIAKEPNAGLTAFGLLIGFLSSLLGIGGGSITFLILIGYHIPVQNASATASASTLLTTFLGTLMYLVLGETTSEPHSYINWTAFLAISGGALLTAPFGVKLSHTLPTPQIKRVFGACLSLVGINMLFF